MAVDSLVNVHLTLDQTRMVQRFLAGSGYGRQDILARNYRTGIFMTRNGGRYRVAPSGRVSWISGPALEPEERD